MSGTPERLGADAVVVGTGAGGAPVAAVLAESGLDVVALDAGPRLSTADFTGEEAQMTARLMKSRMAESGLAVYAASCVGGSTVVNDALCFRTPPEVLAAWRRDFGLVELTERGFAPYVERAWQDLHASPTGRAHLNRNAHRLEVGARRLGWRAEATPRSVRGCVNLGLCNLGCPSGAKQSTRLTYVPRAERAGARVLAPIRATRIRVAAGRVQGIEGLRLDPVSSAPVGEVRVDAPLVCLAAGVLESAPLLLRSGISGRADRVGRDLQFHSTLQVAARFPEPIHGYYGPTMAYSVTEFGDVNGQTGPGFLIENVAAHPFVTAQALAGFGEEHARIMAALPYLARSLVLLRDRTRGRIEIGREGPGRLRYAHGPEEWERLRAGLREASRAFLASGALEVHPSVNGCPPLRSESDLSRLDTVALGPGRVALVYAVHLFGGAAMADAPERGFCDVRGESYDVAGLYVSDASCLPSNTGVNPQITIVANALRIADGLVAEHG